MSAPTIISMMSGLATLALLPASKSRMVRNTTQTLGGVIFAVGLAKVVLALFTPVA